MAVKVHRAAPPRIVAEEALPRQKSQGSLKARPQYASADTLFYRCGWLLVLLGMVLRLLNAGGKPLWFDEIVTLSVPAQAWDRILVVAATPGTNSPPLFPLLFKIWMYIGQSDDWLRTGTAFIGVGILGCTWVLGCRLFGVRTALLGTAFCTFSPYQVAYSQYVRMYGLLAFTGLLSLVCLLRALDSRRPLWWLLWCASASACLYSFYFAGFLLAGEVLWLGLLSYHDRTLLRPAAWATALIGLSYLPWVPSMLRQIHDGGSRAWMARPTAFTLRYTIEQFFFLNNSETVAQYGFWVVLVLIGLGVISPGDRRARLALGLVTGCGILLPYFASLVVQPFYDPRYLIYGSVGLYLFAARGLGRALNVLRPSRVGRPAPWRIAAATAVISAATISPLTSYYLRPETFRPDVRGAILLLLRQAQPGDLIAFNDPFDYLPAIWYAHQFAGTGSASSSQPYVWMPSSWVHMVPLHQVLINANSVKNEHWLPAHGRVWLVSTVSSHTRSGQPRVSGWFSPPQASWRLLQSITTYYRLYLRLYVKR